MSRWEVEAVRRRVAQGVAVGGGQADHHGVAPRDLRPGDLQGLGGEPERGVLHRALVAQGLLHRRVHEAHVGAQGRELAGVGEQGTDGSADQVDRRLVARDQQDEGHAAQFARGEPVAVLGGGAHEITQQVAGRARAPLVLDQLGEVRGKPCEGVVLGLRAARCHRLRGHAAELRAVQLGHAQQLADHRDRQRVREGVHQVGPAARQHRVEQFVGDLLDPRLQFLHAARGEGARDQRAQPGVLGRVGDQQVLADEPFVEELQADPGGVLGQARVAERRAGLLVADDEPCLVMGVDSRQPHPVHRPALAQERVHRMRVGAEAVAELPQIDQFRHVARTCLPPPPVRWSPVPGQRAAPAASALPVPPAVRRRRPTGRSARGC